MEISYLNDVCPRIIIHSFLSESDFISYNKSFAVMMKEAYPGTYHQNKDETLDTSFKSRLEFHFRKFKDHPEIQNMEKIWWNAFMNRKLQHFYHECGGIFSYLNLFNSGSLIGAQYEQGGLYQEHADDALVSSVFFHANDSVTGGEFVLTSSNTWSEAAGIEKKTVSIPYEKNTVLIFPSRYQHSVESVTQGPRLSTQCFLYFSESDSNSTMAKIRLLNR